MQLAEKNIGGKKVELPNGFVVCRGYNNLIFNQPRMSVRRTPYGEAENLSSVPCLPCVAIRAKQGLLSSVILDVPGQTQFGRHLINATIFDAGLGKGLTAESTEDAEKKIKFRKSSAISAGSAVKGCYVEWFDLDRVKLPLIVRPRKAGDRFVPLGLREEKKIGKFLTATKVQEDVRKEVLIVADSEKIIWVWPVRISEQVKITGETKGILQLQIGNINPAQQLNKKNG